MARGFDLDFARTRPASPWWTWLLLAAGLAAALWAGRAWQLAQAGHGDQLRRLEHLRQARPAAVPPARRGNTRPAASLERLDLPWGRLLATLESTRPQTVALLSLEAEARHGRLDLTAEAQDYAAMIDYYRQLQAAPGLGEVTLTQHGVREDGPARPVRFTLRARWAGGTAGTSP